MALEKASKGFWGRILHVDLATGKSFFEELGDDFFRKYLGGIGISAKVLWDSMTPGIDPLGQENVLVFTPGLLTDTGAMFSGRFTVAAKSPASNSWGDANCGGFFAPALKRCGIDALVIHGKSLKPVYIYLDQDTVTLEDASSLWGLDTIEAENRLQDIHGKKARIVTIGPGGEKLSYLAGIFHDRGRAAARCGLGAVMGSKKLKAIVAAGNIRVGVANKAVIKSLSQEFVKRLNKLKSLDKYLGDGLLGLVGRLTRPGLFYVRQPCDLWRLLLRKFGTCSLTAMSCEGGDSPVRNWTGIGFKDFPLSRSQKIGAGSVIKYEIKKYGCFSCPIRCGGIVYDPEAPNRSVKLHKPEYETICAFGTLLLNDDLRSIFRINEILNRAGLDTISGGATVAFAIECYDNGLINNSDTDGLELRWGNSGAIIGLVEKIAKREGIGDILADGVKRAAEQFGGKAQEYAVHCGGIEVPMHDPRFDPGFLASYCLEPTPGRHTITAYQYLDLQYLEKIFPSAPKIPTIATRRARFDYKAKAKGLAIDAFYKMLIDCAGLCLFGTQVGGQPPIWEWLNAATGWDLNPDQYLTIGERVHKLRHAFNVREGINPAKDFSPHPRIIGNPPLKKGPARDVTLDFDQLTREYYDVMEWDRETGKPTKESLRRLDLKEILDTLHSKEP